MQAGMQNILSSCPKRKQSLFCILMLMRKGKPNIFFLQKTAALVVVVGNVGNFDGGGSFLNICLTKEEYE